MLKSTLLIGLILGVSTSAMAERSVIGCYNGEEKKGELFDGKAISTSKKKPLIYSEQYLNRECQTAYGDGDTDKLVARVE